MVFTIVSRRQATINTIKIRCRNLHLTCMGFIMALMAHLSNISNMRCSVSSPDDTPRRELKIRRAAEYF